MTLTSRTSARVTALRPSRALTTLSFLTWVLQGVGKRTCRDARPRTFSNLVLREYLRFLGGDVINVSGWQDSDKEGSSYRSYYGSCTRYVVSNISGDAGLPSHPSPEVESIFLDLAQPLAPELEHRFDVVFSHTVLEHIFEPHLALETLDRLSKDVVVVVVPFSQAVHYSQSYGDYYRLSPLLLKRFFEERGYSVLLCASNDQPLFHIYVVFIASRYPERHEAAFRSAPRFFECQIRPDRFGRYGRPGFGLTAMEEE